MKPLFIKAQIRIRGDEGATGELKGPELFLFLDGRLHPVRQIQSDPGVLPQQVIGYTPEDRLLLDVFKIEEEAGMTLEELAAKLEGMQEASDKQREEAYQRMQRRDSE